MSKHKGNRRSKIREPKSALDEIAEGAVATVGVSGNGVDLFRLEHIEAVETERVALTDEPALENTLGTFTGRIGGFYLVIPKGGYAQNPTVQRAHQDRVIRPQSLRLGIVWRDCDRKRRRSYCCASRYETCTYPLC